MKAILVIDMPKRCEDCPCWRYMKCFTALDGKTYHNWCKALIDPNSDDTGSKGMMTEEQAKNKPSWCPLKPIPQKAINDERPTDKSIIDHSFCEGWNACIDEILGETDD